LSVGGRNRGYGDERDPYLAQLQKLGRVLEINGEQPCLLEGLQGLLSPAGSQIAGVIVFHGQDPKSRVLKELNLGSRNRETAALTTHALRRCSNSSFKIRAYPIGAVKQLVEMIPGGWAALLQLNFSLWREKNISGEQQAWRIVP